MPVHRHNMRPRRLIEGEELTRLATLACHLRKHSARQPIGAFNSPKLQERPKESENHRVLHTPGAKAVKLLSRAGTGRNLECRRRPLEFARKPFAPLRTIPSVAKELRVNSA